MDAVTCAGFSFCCLRTSEKARTLYSGPRLLDSYPIRDARALYICFMMAAWVMLLTRHIPGGHGVLESAAKRREAIVLARSFT
jgi:hypothetical protein